MYIIFNLVNQLLLGNTVDKCGGANEGSYLERFIKLHKNSTPEERGAYLDAKDINPEEKKQSILYEAN